RQQLSSFLSPDHSAWLFPYYIIPILDNHDSIVEDILYTVRLLARILNCGIILNGLPIKQHNVGTFPPS
ncbi:hypothetical protein HKBW3S06_01736, partial [Candidatus Hakubella thermalkaliphila]